MAWGIQGLINASDLKHCNLLVLGRGKGSWKSVLVLIRQWGEAKMFLCWGEAAGEAGTGAGDGSWGAGPCPAGTARTVNSCVFQGCSSEAFLLVAIPQGCSCSPLAVVLSILRALLLLCTVRVVENFKTNICQQHIISCGCPSHEFFTLLCLSSCTLLHSDHAPSLPSYSLVQVSFNVETSLHCWSPSGFFFNP